MKKFILIFIASLAMMAASMQAKAQYVTRYLKDSNVAAQTRYITVITTPASAAGIQATFTKSGSTTIAGTATLEYRIDTLGSYDWVPIRGTSLDSLTIPDGNKSILWPLTNQYQAHPANAYRVKVVSTGSGKFYTNVALLRWQP